MIKFISKVENLKTIISFLSDNSTGIVFEAFMLLEVLIKNLEKSTNPDIKHIILHNKITLIQFVKELDVEVEEEYKPNKETMLLQLESLEEE